MKIIITILLYFLLANYSLNANDQVEIYKNYDLKINQKIGYHASETEGKMFYLFNSIQYEVEKMKNLYYLNSINLPSDLIEVFTSDSKAKSFEILINQGRLPKEIKADHFNRNIQNEENYFHGNHVLVDYPSGYLYHSVNYSPDNFSSFKNFFDLFSTTFKITLNPLLDRSSYIQNKFDNNKFDVFFFDNNEKACTEHLDAIKETLPVSKWNEFMEKINYLRFSQSEYKNIKYFIKYSPDENKIKFSFKVIFKIEKIDMSNYRDLLLFKIIKTNENKDKNNINKSQVLFNSFRYFDGQISNFNNFFYSNEFTFQFEKNKFNGNLKIIDLIPNQLNILLSTIKISLDANGISFYFDHNNLDHIFEIDIIESVEEQHPVVPFTYESKKTTKLYFKLKENFVQNYLSSFANINLNFRISYELRKKILNFESYDNNQEYGFKFPCGLIIYENIPYITNHIYFNMPNVDDTMPFNIIAFSWVVYGFILVQILNLFITGGKSEKSLWQSIKDRFMAKWGFLFGR